MATASGVAAEKVVTAADVAQRLHAMARLGPLAIFSDIDGTVSPIAPQPDAAFVLPDAVDAFGRLVACGVTVVLVTGRAAADARAMVGLHQVGYAGNHGFELLVGGEHVVAEEVQAAARSIALAVVEVERRVTEAGIDGILFEDKGYTGSVHYRLAADPEEAKLRLLPILRGVVDAAGLRLTEGRLVYEIRPSIPMSKGVFVRDYLTANRHAAAAFLGDDVTDVDGFAAIQAARASGEVTTGLNVAVAASESPQQVLDESDVVVGGTSEMARALSLLAGRMEGDVDA